MRPLLLLLFFIGVRATSVFAQELPGENIDARPLEKSFGMVNTKIGRIQERMHRLTLKSLWKLRKSEKRLQKDVVKSDTLGLHHSSDHIDEFYDSLQNLLNHSPSGLQTSYSGRIDSMTTALRFLKTRAPGQATEQYDKALQSYAGIQGKLDRTEFVQQQLKAHEEMLKKTLERLPASKVFARYQKELFYYKTTFQDYKTLLNNPTKIEQAVLKIALAIPAFKKFFNKYSLLGAVFRLPGTDEPDGGGLTGLQTRALIEREALGPLGLPASGPGSLSGTIEAAQDGLKSLKERINSSGARESGDIPDFKPNAERTKSFLHRLELGTNFQSTKSDRFFPTTSDLGLSIGYRLKQSILVGIGASYKLGLGKDFRHIAISHEGVALRSFLDIKMKGSIWISGGAEMNYRDRFKEFSQLKNVSLWQSSALIGLSKKYQVGKKAKGNVQVLYDFLHDRQRPVGKPVIFRMGYNLK